MNRSGSARRGWGRRVGTTLGVAVVIFIAIQLIPLDRTNPAVVQEPAWDTPVTRALVKDACFDCHSNETVWPWYARIAPASWLIWRDVDEGRSKLNFSDWGRAHEGANEIAEVVNEGEMPPWYYAMMHPEARLSDAEKQALIAGMRATLGAAANGEGAG